MESRKVAIVTGGANGLGAGIATRLVSVGWNVAIFDVLADKGIEFVKSLGEDRAAFLQCDVSSYPEQAQAFSQVWEKWGRLDALVANAGFMDRSSAYIRDHRGKTDLPPEPNLSCTNVCWKGLVFGTRLAVHFMRQNKHPGGKIVATSSLVGAYPMATFPEYGSVKAAIMHFVKSAAPILKMKDNITLNTVAPGAILTRLESQGLVKAIGAECNTPVESLVRQYEAFLTDETGELNGQCIEVSGSQGHEGNHIYPAIPYVNGDISRKTSTVYEGYFKKIHGEYSGLSGIVGLE